MATFQVDVLAPDGYTFPVNVHVDLRWENGMPFQTAAFALEVVASSAPLQAAELSPMIMSKLSTIGSNLNMPPTEPQEYRIDFILGADHYSQVIGKHTPLGGGLQAYHMPFRTVLCGPVPGPGLVRQGVHNKKIRGNACLLVTAIGCMDSVDTENPGDAVSLLHSLDAIGLGETVSKTEDPAAIHFRCTVEQLKDGRYQVELPLRKDLYSWKYTTISQ